MTGVLSSSLQETDRGLFILVKQRRFIKAVPKTSEDWQEGFEPTDENIVFQAENLSFSYDDEREVLRGLNFSTCAITFLVQATSSSSRLIS